MTVGPDLDWLADPQGNLRPDIARAIAETPDRLAVAPPPLAEMGAPVAAAPRTDDGIGVASAARPATPPRRPAGVRPPIEAPPRVREITIPVPDLAALGHGVPALAVIAVVAIISGAVGGMMSGHINQTTSGGLNAVPTEQPNVIKAPAAAALATPSPTAAISAIPAPASSQTLPTAAVIGINVNLRNGPGLEYAVVGRLLPGATIIVSSERDGWCAITTASGGKGWVYAGFVHGLGRADRGPAAMQQMLVSNGPGPQVVLRPGQRVFRILGPNGTSTVLLPGGQRLAVRDEALASAE